VSFGDVGECTVTAAQAADADYEAGSDSQWFTVGKGSQAITFTSEAPSGAHPDDTFDVVATGGARDQAVTYGSATPAVCSVDGATVTLLAAGACTSPPTGRATTASTPPRRRGRTRLCPGLLPRLSSRCQGRCP
jgi:hypothetical protein